MKQGDRVELEVSSCEYRCCGGGWSTRGQATYRGQILDVFVSHGSTKCYLVQCGNELGKMAELIVRQDQLISVKPLERTVD